MSSWTRVLQPFISLGNFKTRCLELLFDCVSWMTQQCYDFITTFTWGEKNTQTIENSLWNCYSRSMECRNHVLSPGSQIPTSLTYITAFSYFWCFDFRSLCLQLLLFVTKGNNHNYLLLISTFAYWGSFSLFCFICKFPIQKS